MHAELGGAAGADDQAGVRLRREEDQEARRPERLRLRGPLHSLVPAQGALRPDPREGGQGGFHQGRQGGGRGQGQDVPALQGSFQSATAAWVHLAVVGSLVCCW